MNVKHRNFDEEALTWDDNPHRRTLAKEISNAIFANVSIANTMDLLDFGCGTGLISLNFHKSVHSVVAVDSSKGMIDVLNKKIIESNIDNIKTQCIGDNEKVKGSYSIIVSSMTFHHILNIDNVIRNFRDILQPNGVVCIADLDLDNGEFHDVNDGVFHFGFDRNEFKMILEKNGFKNVKIIDASMVRKPVNGEQKCFTVFLAIGDKS